MKIHLKPMTTWPAHQPATPPGRRKAALFTAYYPARLDFLEHELGQVNAKDVILQAFLSKSQSRADGWPFFSAKATGPGVILAFTSNGDQREFVADNYDDWKDNLYGIAKTLEALRGIDRWRGRTDGKQYAGFAPVLAPKPVLAAFTSPEAAAAFIAQHADGWSAGQILGSGLVLKQARNNAATKLHPDVGGDHEDFVRLEQAREILEKHQRRIK